MAKGFKSGGRTLGVANKISGSVREMISKSLTAEIEMLPGLLDQLKPKDRVDSLIKLLPFIIPKAEEADVPERNMLVTHQSFVEHIVKQVQEKRQNQQQKNI